LVQAVLLDLLVVAYMELTLLVVEYFPIAVLEMVGQIRAAEAAEAVHTLVLPLEEVEK
jgi:hypothetical protein